MARSEEEFRQRFATRVQWAMGAQLSVRGLQIRLTKGARGRSYNNVNNSVKGRTTPNAQLVADIAEALDCDPGWLLAGVGEAVQEPMSDEEAVECGLTEVPPALRNSIISAAVKLAPQHYATDCGLDAVFATMSELARQLGKALMAPFSGAIALPEDQKAALAILSSQLRVIRWAASAGHIDIELPERLGRPTSSLDRSDEAVQAIMRGEEPDREVGPLSVDQRQIDEHRKKARLSEARKNTEDEEKERRRYALVQEQLYYARRMEGELPDDMLEPAPDTPGPAVVGDKYKGPPVPEPEEIPDEERQRILAERDRTRKAKE